MKYHNELRGKPRTLPRLGSWVRIPSPAPKSFLDPRLGRHQLACRKAAMSGGRRMIPKSG
jgi:hypothetical protein